MQASRRTNYQANNQTNKQTSKLSQLNSNKVIIGNYRCKNWFPSNRPLPRAICCLATWFVYSVCQAPPTSWILEVPHALFLGSPAWHEQYLKTRIELKGKVEQTVQTQYISRDKPTQKSNERKYTRQRHTNKHACKQASKQTNRQTNKQASKETTNKHTVAASCSCARNVAGCETWTRSFGGEAQYVR